MFEVLTFIASLTLFPGLVFVVALALFSEWYIRKMVARAQSRMGPAYVGPIGILQPLADLLKLLTVKEEIKQKYASLGLAKAFMFTGIGAATASVLLLPLSPFRLTSPYDFLIYAYLCCVWVPLAMTMYGMSVPNPFTAIGVSRLLSLVAVIEPVYFASILVPVTLTTYLYGPSCHAPFSIYCTSINSWRLWANPLTVALMVLGLVAVLVSVQAKAMLQPFNIPEAEQEVIAGFATEFSGPLLALNNVLHDVDIAVTALFITYLYLGGPYPLPHTSLPGVLILIAKYLLVLTLMVIVKASFGRFRIEQGIGAVLKYGGIPAAIAVVAASIIPLVH